MNYFDLYELPVSFLVDENYIRNKYLQLSRKFHPDFYTNESPEKQLDILKLSTENNNAFKTLSDFDKRMKYILKESGQLGEEEKYTLPQMFLMEMMDLNELVMEIQFDPSPEKLEQVSSRIETSSQLLMNEILPLLEQFDLQTATSEVYHQIREFYYKRRYLMRIREQLEKLQV